jgi:hypothetical protein
LAAKRRWQAQAITKAAEAEKRDMAQTLDDAKAGLKDARGRVVVEEAGLKKATAEDWSRVEARGAIFMLIIFARSLRDQPRA